MKTYSDCIIETMKHIDKEIEKINSKSLDRGQLHINIKISIVANIKKLMSLSLEERANAIDYIFKTQLNTELLKKQKISKKS